MQQSQIYFKIFYSAWILHYQDFTRKFAILLYLTFGNP